MTCTSFNGPMAFKCYSVGGMGALIEGSRVVTIRAPYSLGSGLLYVRLRVDWLSDKVSEYDTLHAALRNRAELQIT